MTTDVTITIVPQGIDLQQIFEDTAKELKYNLNSYARWSLSRRERFGTKMAHKVKNWVMDHSIEVQALREWLSDRDFAYELVVMFGYDVANTGECKATFKFEDPGQAMLFRLTHG